MLKDGGVYPVPVPLGWKLIDQGGQEIEIQTVPGHPFHRILARGALLAVEGAGKDQPECIMFNQYSLPPGPLTTPILDRYVSIIMDRSAASGCAPKLTSARVTTCALSEEPCLKVVTNRTSPSDTRSEIRYLLRDNTRQGWELVYLIRRQDFASWEPLLAEIEGPP
ncbi:MAG TPA: hypothetical protein VG269_20615 [Tepidisphaeraceae bacterium]|nr:hypothetical protein [Tepidisphaeraceae bacterium]